MLYSLADLTIYPSLLEGFGMPVLEAFHCDCPVLTSNITSLPEVAGDAAYVVDPYDTDQIADGIFWDGNGLLPAPDANFEGPRAG